MSTVAEHVASRLPPPNDPFLYGWRYEVGPNGEFTNKRIPLTLQDVLHPREGDEIVENEAQLIVRTYLYNGLVARLSFDASIVVLADVGIYWYHPLFENHSPDVSVIFGVKNRKERYRSFNVKEEGVIPRLLIEIVSPDTRSNDIGDKVREYHLVKVPYYIIIDRENFGDDWKLIGYEYTPSHYVRMPTDDRGRLWLEPVQLYLGVEGKNVVLYDGKTDEPIQDYTSLTRSLQAQKKLAQAEKKRAEKETKRAEKEMKRAEQETQARQALEARLKEMEAELARLRESSK